MSLGEYTWSSYAEMIETVKNRGYSIANYHNFADFEYPCILRHDIDHDLQEAIKMATIESELGVTSTYFFLLSSDFYNLFSKEGRRTLRYVESLGHEVALHFDIEQHEYSDFASEVGELAEEEAGVISALTSNPVSVVSFHRPSKESLEGNIEFPSLINSYSKQFFSQFKYISDSAMRWREDPNIAINPKLHSKLHILTHPIWYSDDRETLAYKLNTFVGAGCQEKYDEMDRNFLNLEEYIDRESLAHYFEEK
jgi:hypothetical protein